MEKPFKFRYVNEIVGTFVLVMLALLVAGIVLAGKAQGWFAPKQILHVQFPAAGSGGIKNGAEVVILGTTVGTVTEVDVASDGRMEGVLKIKGEFMRFVRSDSQAVIKLKFGIAGDAYLDITKGNGAPLTGDPLYLPCRKDTELVETLQVIVVQVREEIVPLLDAAKKAIVAYTGVADDLRSTNGPVQSILRRVDSLIAGLQQGDGAAGKILSDPGTAAQVTNIVGQVNLLMAELQRMMGDVQLIMGDVKKVTGALPQMTLQTQDAIWEAQKLVEGIQRHWLLRSYVEQTPVSPMIDPAQVSAPDGSGPPPSQPPARKKRAP